MSLRRTVAAAVVAAIAIVAAVSWPREAVPVTPAAGVAGPPSDPPAVRTERSAAPSAVAAATPPTPALPDGPPFREQDFAVTTDMPEGAVVALRSSARVGRALAVELGTTMPLPEGKRVFANVSVSDGLGNTIMDCTWRDVELTDDVRKLDCELPADVELPLSIAGYQLPAPSFVEAPVVVATDTGVHR